MQFAEFLIDAVIVYGWCGLAMAAAFLLVGLDRIEEDARGAWAFRPLLIPGVVVLWPLVGWLWLKREREH